MRLNNLYIILGMFFCTLPSILAGQDSFRFEASADARQVLLNGYFEVTFTLKNASGSDFTPPPFSNFTVLAGPSSSSSMQIINGEVSREMAFSFTLQPKKEGKFTIGSATIRANGKKITSNPLTIEVIKGSIDNSSESSGEEFFVKLEVNKTRAFVGEQILLDFKLYTAVSIDGYDIQQEPEYQGFYAQDLRRFDSSPLREVVNGKQFTTKILRRIALFPQQTGNLTISPARLQLAIVEENDRTGFFFNRNIRPVFYTTNALQINIEPLPPGAPENFSGAVGEYEFKASVSQSRVSTDEAISLKILIAGNGDVKRVQPPSLMLSDSFEIYPPKVIEEQMSESHNGITGTKLIEYLLLPKYPGTYYIAPSFSYFNTFENKYMTETSGRFLINVLPGSDRHENRQSHDNTEVEDIRFLKTKTTLVNKNESFISTPAFWSLTVLPLFAFLGIFFVQKRREINNNNIDLKLTKSRTASKEAQKRLATALEYYKAGNSRAFYDEVSKASLGYVSDKLDIPLSRLSKDNVREKLMSLNVSTPLIDDFMRVLQRCEMALFAGMDQTGEMQATYERAIAVISGIETEIGTK